MQSGTPAGKALYHDGYAEARITIGGTVHCLHVEGDYPDPPDPVQVLGANIADIPMDPEMLEHFKKVLVETLTTGKCVNIAVYTRSRRRIGHTERVSKRSVILRLFTPKKGAR